MITKHKNIRRWLTSFAVVTVLLAAAAPVFPESALATTLKQGGTTVTVSPAKTVLTCNQSKQVDILINDVTDLFGVDLKIGYDPNVVEVVDADAANPGVQVKPGNLPDVSGGQGLVQENIVDVATGTINYSAIRLAPAPAQSGSGVIVSITFKGKAAGSSPVKLTAVALANETALPIEATKTDGAINVSCDGQTPDPATATATRPPGGASPTPTRPGGKVTPVPPYGKVTPVPGTGKGYPVPLPYPGKGGAGCSYVVKPGDTLYSIALAYGVTVQAIASANGIANPNYIYAGQTLVIPGCGGTGQPQPPTSGDCFSYTVQAGDTLSSIAWAYGDTVAGLTYRNGIVNPNLIRAGQTLQVCPGGGSGGYPGKPTYPTYPTKPGTGKPWPIACAQTYVVQPGDTLYSIGLAYGVSVNALMKVNNLYDPNVIRVGQTLCIPSY